MNIYDNRLKNVKEYLKKNNLFFLLLTPSSDLLYLTGYSKPATDRFTALILSENHAYFLCPILEKNYLSEVTCEVDFVFWKDDENPFLKAFDLLGISKNSVVSVAIGAKMQSGWLLMMMQLFPKLSWNSADSILSFMRKIKSPEEANIIRSAQNKAERAFQKLLNSGLEGKTEKQLSEQFIKLRFDEGFDSVGAGLIACGPNSASPHPILTDRKIRSGDTVLFDFGGTYRGYHADMSRTCAVGHVTAEFKEIYSIVLKAHLAAFDVAAPGVPCCEMDWAGRNLIENSGYGAYFTHRLGHGIGLDIHESPYAIAGNHELLAIGNVLSDEPGIYLPNRFGIRIEDLILITKEGAETLNTMSKELLIV